MRLLICTAAALAAASALAVGAGADPAATPVATGCPAGFSLFAVQAYNPVTYPYRLPARLDNTANGGNGDGYICALQLPDAVRDAFCLQLEPGACYLEQNGFHLYNFTEDNNPAQAATSALLDFGS